MKVKVSGQGRSDVHCAVRTVCILDALLVEVYFLYSPAFLQNRKSRLTGKRLKLS
jgi:hypothetical protein